MADGARSEDEGLQSQALVVRPLTREDWPHIETLFGDRGACGGCWCMSWRVQPHGKTWRAATGEPNRVAFRELVNRGAVHGCLAFAGEEPVGWCNLGPREDFPYLNASKKYRTDWSTGTWAVVCFFIQRAWRRRGVATALLAAAVAVARTRGARVLEGFPVPSRWARDGSIPAAFAWTGTEPLFIAAGFERISPADASQPYYLRSFD